MAVMNIQVFYDLTVCRLIVTDVSEVLTYFTFRVQAVQTTQSVYKNASKIQVLLCAQK